MRVSSLCSNDIKSIVFHHTLYSWKCGKWPVRNRGGCRSDFLTVNEPFTQNNPLFNSRAQGHSSSVSTSMFGGNGYLCQVLCQICAKCCLTNVMQEKLRLITRVLKGELLSGENKIPHSEAFVLMETYKHSCLSQCFLQFHFSALCLLMTPCSSVAASIHVVPSVHQPWTHPPFSSQPSFSSAQHCDKMWVKTMHTTNHAGEESSSSLEPLWCPGQTSNMLLAGTSFKYHLFMWVPHKPGHNYK